MNEERWLSANAPAPLLAWLAFPWEQRGHVRWQWRPDRKLRLFACAICRDLGELLTGDLARAAVEAAEGFADGLVKPRDLETARRRSTAPAATAATAPDAALAAQEAAQQAVVRQLAVFDAAQAEKLAQALHATEVRLGQQFEPAVAKVLRRRAQAHLNGEVSHARNQELSRLHRLQCGLLREIFGNPFHPIDFETDWRTPEVSLVARAIYEEDHWEELPILADALEEAGCTDERLLEHARAGGPHYRGCWLVDLVLGLRA